MSEQDNTLHFTPEFNVVVKEYEYAVPDSVAVSNGKFMASYPNGETKELEVDLTVVNGKLIISKPYSYIFTDDGNGNITVTRRADNG